MKKIFAILTLLCFNTLCFGHAFWIETNQQGQLNKEHLIKVFYGEFSYNAIEDTDGESFQKMKNFDLFIYNSEGVKTKLDLIKKQNHYETTFTPRTLGTYTIILNNDNIEVIDFSKYDFGIFKTHYHSVAKVEVGDLSTETIIDNNNGLAIQDISASSDSLTLQLFYKNKPLIDTEIEITLNDQWKKVIKTNSNGQVRLNLPFKTNYCIEATFKEEVPGNYLGKDYEFIWHCVTYFITQSTF